VKKVLIISYFFPPRPGVASLRLGGLAKYLPEFGWKPTILTAKLHSPSDPRYRVIETEDSDILIEWKRRLGFSPERTFRDQLGQTDKKDTYMDYLLNTAKEILAYPDYNKKWYRYALPVARDLLKREKFNAIISSAGPYTTHLIARELKKESGIPWIADFRDLWTQNHYYSYSRIRKYFETKLEVRTLMDADAITTVSYPLADKLRRIHHAPVFVVPNGFDPDLLNYDVAVTRKFSIVYTGRLYRGKRDPEPLFRVIKKFIDCKIMDPHDIDIQFWGFFEKWVQDLVEKYTLNSVVSIHGIIPHEQALEKQRCSQILLLLSWDDPSDEGVLTGKIFEYLAARRPVLFLGYSKGVIGDLLNDTQAGAMPGNEQELEEILKTFYRQFKVEGKVRYSGIDSRIILYTHKEMAYKLSTVLDEVVKIHQNK
jgi:hypothetical protein